MCFDLVDLVVGPLPVEAQHRDAPLVDDARVDLAVAVLVRDHLAAPGEADRRAVEPAVVVLELLCRSRRPRGRPISTPCTVDAAHEAGAGHAAAAADLDVVAAREVELLVVEPPRHVEVRAADAVLVVRHVVHQLRDEAARRRCRSCRSGTCRRCRSSWRGPAGSCDDFELSRMRADSHALAASTTMRARTWLSRAGASCRCRRRRRQPVVVDRDLARHRVGDDRQLAGRQRRRQQHGRRREVRVRRAAAVALPAVVARRRGR